MNEFYFDTFFKLGEAYEYGAEISKEVSERITGNARGKPHDYGVLAQAIVNSGHGDFVEVGTLFGASAIIAALVKKRFDVAGKVVCIDPLDGYYGHGRKVDKLLVSPGMVRRSAALFGVALELVTEKSYPWPLKGREFACAYIDGNHDGDMPRNDWLSASSCTSGYIVFDNYDKSHPAVVAAVGQADWRLVHVSSISAVFSKSE